MDLNAIWQLYLWGPVAHCVRWGSPITPWQGQIWVEPPAKTCNYKLQPNRQSYAATWQIQMSCWMDSDSTFCPIITLFFVKESNIWRLCSAFYGKAMAQLWSVTCHMGSHSVTCHPTQLNMPCLSPSHQAGTWFGYPRGMKGKFLATLMVDSVIIIQFSGNT